VTTYQVVVSQTPAITLEVGEAEAVALYRQGLVVSSTPPIPPYAETAQTGFVDGGTPSARGDLVKLRSGTAAEWATAETGGARLVADEVALVDGEVVVGDGSTTVASLPRVGDVIDGGTL
jgi:hypothetical protein